MGLLILLVSARPTTATDWARHRAMYLVVTYSWLASTGPTRAFWEKRDPALVRRISP